MYQNARRSCQLAPDSSRRSSEPLNAIPMTPSIIAHRREKLKIRRRAAAVIMILLIVWVAWSIKIISDRIQTAGQPPVDQITTAEQPTIMPAVIEEPTATPIVTPELEEPVRYELTAEERDLIERVVTAEAVGEPFAGQIAVAQCILNACEKDGIRPLEVLTKYKYTKSRPEPEGTVPEAVAAVFDDGWYVTTEPILYFYAPDRATSDWHESQNFVIEINGHRFFTEKSN
ncbi:hypothetical protein [Tepidibacillus marianensis]|uniref:hypothetical protein n=1 Tax=Tepidibacillus marianensis TaxID=3131995 RepID=UPI0030CBDA5F